MKCPSCGAELVRAEGFPGGLGGSLVRLDCPLPACSRPLIAQVSPDDEDLVLMSAEDGMHAALALGEMRQRRGMLGLVAALGGGGMATLVIAALFLRDGLSNAYLSVLTVLGATGGLSVVTVARRLRAKQNAARLLEALPHLPRALEPVARGYR